MRPVEFGIALSPGEGGQAEGDSALTIQIDRRLIMVSSNLVATPSGKPAGKPARIEGVALPGLLRCWDIFECCNDLKTFATAMG